jgi:hypothetical protein
MLLSVQFPLADSRAFLPEVPAILSIPQWPAPMPDRDFVRGFGIVRRRRLGGLSGWVGESAICEADRAIRMPNFPRTLKVSARDGSTHSFRFTLAFRRFFSDGLAVSKFEIGVSGDAPAGIGLTGEDSELLVRKVLALPATIYDPESKRREVSLIDSGKYVARSYALCTMKTDAINKDTPEDWWVKMGVPLLFLVYRDAEAGSAGFPGREVQLPQDSDCALSFHYVPYNGRDLPMWNMRLKPGRSYRDARALRICLLRLHAERECLRIVLRNIATDKIQILPRSANSDALQQYFNEATRRITGLSTEADSITDTELATLARKSSEQANPGDRDSLLVALRNLQMRRNIFHKIKQYIHTQINYNMRDKIDIKESQVGAVGEGAVAYGNVFNKWNHSGEGMTLDALSKELETLRAKLKTEANTPEHDAAVGAVAQAQVEAKKGNGAKAFEYLAQAGKWALDLAKTIAVPVATQALKSAIGLTG